MPVYFSPRKDHLLRYLIMAPSLRHGPRRAAKANSGRKVKQGFHAPFSSRGGWCRGTRAIAKIRNSQSMGWKGLMAQYGRARRYDSGALRIVEFGLRMRKLHPLEDWPLYGTYGIRYGTPTPESYKHGAMLRRT